MQEGNIAFSKAGHGYHREGVRLSEWRNIIAQAALKEIGRPLLWTGPVWVSLCFVYKRPRGQYGVGKATRPDIDKLARAALDALTGFLWVDDAQVTKLEVMKMYQISTSEAPHLKVIAKRMA